MSKSHQQWLGRKLHEYVQQLEFMVANGEQNTPAAIQLNNEIEKILQLQKEDADE